MELDSLFDDGSAPLEELFPPPSVNKGLPEGTVRDRASKLSIISSPVRNPVLTYQTLIAEHQEGIDSTQKSIEGEIKQRQNQYDLKAVTEILSDPTVPLEQKDRVLRIYNGQKTAPPDVDKELMIQEAAKAPTKPNNPESEVKQFKLSEELDAIHRSASEQQQIMNGFMATLDSQGSKAFLDVMENTFVPFASNKIAAQAVERMKKTGEYSSPHSFIRNFLALGGTIDELNSVYRNMPPEKQVEFVKGLASAYQNTTSILSNKNDYAKFVQMLDITDAGGYGGWNKLLDNVSPFLDVIGMGAFVAGLKTARKAKNIPSAPARVAETPAAPPATPARTAQEAPQSLFKPKTVPTPPVDVAGRSRALDDLFEQRASMLGDSSGLAARGDVRQMQTELNSLKAPTKDNPQYEDALADYNATKLRLEQQIEANKSAAKNEQSLADIDSRIEALQKELEATPAFAQTKLVEAMQRVEWNNLKGVNNPTSTGRLMGAVNPDAGRKLHASVVMAPDDELSVAMFGANRVDTIAHDILPQVTQVGGKVDAKIANLDDGFKNLLLNDEIVQASKMSEGLGLTDKERADLFANTKRDFRYATGLEMNAAMSSFSKNQKNGAFVHSGVYGLPDGGWGDAVSAMEQAKYAFRKYGITEDKITLLQRKGNEFVPVDKNRIPEGPGEYYARVDIEHSFDISDVASPEALDVKRNVFDRIPGLVWNTKGSMNRYVFDTASTLNPTLTRAASVADDKSAYLDRLMLELANDAAVPYRALSADGRRRVDEYMIKANLQGIKTTDANMVAEGLNDAEREVVKKWRRFWDNHFYLENYDLVRTLNSQGYELLDNGTDKFFAKQVKAINAVPTEVNRIYDPTVGNVVDVTRQDLKTLYDNTGFVAKLRRPEVIDGELVEYIKIRNTPTEYPRKINENDSVLNYRDGYFQISYKAPRFVDEIYTDAYGRKITRAVAVAGDSLEAESFAKRMRATDATKQYVVRGDQNALIRSSDEYWDLNSVSGRIAQRHRGKTLEDASGMNHLGDHGYVMDPAEASIKAAHSIAGRTMMRPVLDNMKGRFVQQYGHMLQPNAYGQIEFPNSVNKLGIKGVFSSKEIADARTAWEAINYWENGYLNMVNQAMKGTWNAIGEALSGSAKKGSKTAAVVERQVNKLAESNDVTSIAKSTAFTAYIGTNPLRQYIIQPIGITRLISYSGPQFAIDAIKSAKNLTMNHTLGLKPIERGLYDFVKESGLLDAVDKSNLVRGALVDAAERSNKAVRIGAQALNIPRKMGFDTAERFNLITHLTAVYNKYKRNGFDVSDYDVRAKMQAEARALTLEMNRAGDMVYNQGSGSFLLQFLQVPHKAFLQYTNRKIPKEVRNRLIIGDMILYGAPAVLVHQLYNYDWMPENPKLAEVVKDGMLSTLMNASYRNMMGPDQRKIDLSTIDPRSLDGWVAFYDALMEDGLSKAILNSPAGSLSMRDGGKLQEVVATMSRFFSPLDNQETNAERFYDLALEVARISSGFDNAEKALIMLKTGQELDKMGNTVREKATKLDAIAKAFGFSSYDQTALIKLSMKASKDERKLREQGAEQYKAFKRYITDRIERGETDVEWAQNVIGWVMHSYADAPQMEKIIMEEFRKDFQGRDVQFVKGLMRLSGHKDLDDVRGYVMSSPLSDEQKKQILDDLNYVNSYRESEE